MPVVFKKNLTSHFLYPAIVLILMSILINVCNLDEHLADYIFSLEGGSWAWKNHWLTEHVLHKGGRIVSMSLVIFCAVFLNIAHYQKAYYSHRKPLLYLIIAVAGSSLLISSAKALLAIPCPWEFTRYGGHLPYHNVFTQIFLRNGSGCFPAGQASAGYGWIALYFFGLIYESSWRWFGLVFALTSGVILGGAQQIRGAHFISHDLWTLAVCWFFSLWLYCLMFEKHTLNSSRLRFERYFLQMQSKLFGKGHANR